MFFDISPSAHTHPVIEVQGFRRHRARRSWMLPRRGQPRRIAVTQSKTTEAIATGLAGDERTLVTDHLARDRLTLTAETRPEIEPFVSLPRFTKGVVQSAQLVSCRDVRRPVDASGPAGRRLLRHGYLPPAIDSDGRLPGAPGLF